MTEPGREVSVDAQAEAAARGLGEMVLGRPLSQDEFSALASIFKASVQALKDGFITRLAEHVQAERETESVEEFFENINPM